MAHEDYRPLSNFAVASIIVAPMGISGANAKRNGGLMPPAPKNQILHGRFEKPSYVMTVATSLGCHTPSAIPDRGCRAAPPRRQDVPNWGVRVP